RAGSNGCGASLLASPPAGPECAIRRSPSGAWCLVLRDAVPLLLIGFVAAACFPPNVTRGEHFQEGVAAPRSGQDPGTPGANGGIRRKRRCLAKWNDRQRGPLPKRGVGRCRRSG